MTQQQLQALGIADLPTDQQHDLIADIEQAVLEIAITKLTDTLSKEACTDLDMVIAQCTSFSDLHTYLNTHYAVFTTHHQTALTEYIRLLADTAEAEMITDNH